MIGARGVPLILSLGMAVLSGQEPGYKNSIGMEFVLIPAGEFIMMGSPENENDRSDDEVQHMVRIAHPFFMGRFEVTQRQYSAVMGGFLGGKNPSHFKGEDNPVDTVSWKDATEFCAALSRADGVSYRLPTEAEWEYACRAGTTTPFYFGNTLSTQQANYNGNYTYGDGQKGKYRHKTMSVGSFPANAFGLFDMHGNVWEWCQSLYKPYPYREDDGREDLRGDGARVLRGGSWSYWPGYCRSAARVELGPPTSRSFNLGFRVVVPVEE